MNMLEYKHKTGSEFIRCQNLPLACRSLNARQREVDRGSQTLPGHDCGFLEQLVPEASSLGPTQLRDKE